MAPAAVALAGRVREYTGVEVSPPMAAQFHTAVPQARCIVADLAAVDLGHAAYNLCFSWGALCHLRAQAQMAALAIAACHTTVGGRIMFTGGRDAGSCQGQVGPHRVQHYSLGAVAYDALFASLGCQPQFQGEVEYGAAYLFAYTRIE